MINSMFFNDYSIDEETSLQVHILFTSKDREKFEE